MVRTFLLTALSAALVCFAPVSVGQVTPTESLIDVARFFNLSGSALYFSRDAAQALRSKDANAARAIEESLMLWNQEVADARVANLLRAELTTDDVTAIRRFAATSTGKRLAEFFRGSPTNFGSSLRSLNVADRQRAEAFLASPAATKVLSVSESNSTVAMWRAYGQELMCLHLSKSDQVAFARAQAAGKCPA